jgi:hypothetical protein
VLGKPADDIVYSGDEVADRSGVLTYRGRNYPGIKLAITVDRDLSPILQR